MQVPSCVGGGQQDDQGSSWLSQASWFLVVGTPHDRPVRPRPMLGSFRAVAAACRRARTMVEELCTSQSMSPARRPRPAAGFG